MALVFPKKLFGDTTTVKLNVVDPFGTYNYRWGINVQDIAMKAHNRYNTTEYALSVTYDFGKQIDKMRQRNSSADATGRQSM